MDVTDDSPSRVVTLRADIENRITKLAKLICIELGNPLSSKATVQASMDRLLRLGLGEHARDIFLDTRSTSIRHRRRYMKEKKCFLFLGSLNLTAMLLRTFPTSLISFLNLSETPLIIMELVLGNRQWHLVFSCQKYQ